VTTTEAEVTAAHRAGTATPKLNKALSQLQGELPQIKKTKTAEVKDQQGNRVLYKYDYADLGDVVADVGPLLAKHGLAFHCGPTINPADRREMILLWALLHESGEEKAGEWPLGPVNQKPQALGSAITYGRRYCFTAATNIVLEDDDDGQRAQQDHGSRQSAGDAWENATPARAGGGRPARQPEQPAAGAEGSSWYRRALAEADRFATKDAGDKLFVDAARAGRDGVCTPRQVNHVQNVIQKRLKLFENAIDVEDLARQAAAQHEDSGPGFAADLAPGEAAEYDTERHAKVVGVIWQHLGRLGYPAKNKETDEEKARRLADVAKLARVAEIGSTSDLDLGELSLAADTLARCKNRDALGKLLKTGEGHG
jgi:hypothetical protein